MASVRFSEVRKAFGVVEVLHGVSVDIEEGQFVVLVGPSGCGKSTLLRLLAGLEHITSGEILIGEEVVNQLPPKERDIAMVFQNYALYPHLTVAENMGFSLMLAKRTKSEIEDKVRPAAEILGLSQLLDRYPRQLSGGQRQRVAIGRAIVREPKGFLFDEPLSNLDAALRVQMRFEIARLHKTLNTTMIYVTHDQVEAMTLADKIVVLKDGLIMQVGSPRELYERPDNLFVAQFIGSPKMNVVPCTASGGKFKLEGQPGGAMPKGLAEADIVQLGIRPEHILVGEKKGHHCAGTIEVAEYLGADTFLYVDCGAVGQINVRTSGENELRAGDPVHLTFDLSKVHFFGADEQVVR